jgi:hypothetical protein
MLPSNMPLLNLILLFDVTFSTSTGFFTHYPTILVWCNICNVFRETSCHPRQRRYRYKWAEDAKTAVDSSGCDGAVGMAHFSGCIE